MNTPTSFLVADFARTMDALDQGVLVRSIMSEPLVTIGPDDDAAAFFEQRRVDGFDCAPVEQAGRIIGMVYKSDLDAAGSPRRAADAMRSLDRVPIVAGTETVSSLMRVMRQSGEHFWLVLNGTEINAIVTRSDLWRLPVRMLAMCRLVHLEKLMQELIRSRTEGTAWMAVFTEDRRRKVEGVLKVSAARNEQLDLLECTSFSDKIAILGHHLGRKSEAKVLNRITRLRDQLMHGREDSDDESGITAFLDHMENIDLLLHQWSKELGPDEQPAPVAGASAP
jgi:CBS domain-containing protein